MNKKVLIFDTRCVTPEVEIHFSIAVDHIEAGDVVQIVNISESMPHSIYKKNGFLSKLQNKYKILNMINYTPHGVAFSTEPLIQFHKLNLPSFKSLEELSTYEVDNIDFGMALASSLVNRLGLDKIKVNRYKKELNTMFQSSVFALESFKNWADYFKPDIVYIRAGRLANNRPILRYCKMNDIAVRVVESGRDPNHYAVVNTYMADRNCLHHYVLQTWNESDHSKELKKSIAHTFYKQKIRGTGNYFNFVKHQNIGLLPLNWDSSKRNYVYYTKTITESVFVDHENSPHTLFGSQIEAIDTIADILSSIPDVHFYVREHPNTFFKFRAESETFNRFRDDPRLTFIPGNSPISTYTLLENANVVITYMSTVGIEAAYWGKPSIVVGNSYYHQLGSVYAPTSLYELDCLLNEKELPVLPKDGAIKYGYHFQTFGKKIRNYAAISRNEGIYKGQNLNSMPPIVRAMSFINRMYLGVFRRMEKIYNTFLIFLKVHR